MEAVSFRIRWLSYPDGSKGACQRAPERPTRPRVDGAGGHPQTEAVESEVTSPGRFNAFHFVLHCTETFSATDSVEFRSMVDVGDDTR